MTFRSLITSLAKLGEYIPIGPIIRKQEGYMVSETEFIGIVIHSFIYLFN